MWKIPWKIFCKIFYLWIRGCSASKATEQYTEHPMSASRIFTNICIVSILWFEGKYTNESNKLWNSLQEVPNWIQYNVCACACAFCNGCLTDTEIRILHCSAWINFFFLSSLTHAPAHFIVIRNIAHLNLKHYFAMCIVHCIGGNEILWELNSISHRYML